MQVNIDGVEYVPAPKLRTPNGTLGEVLAEARDNCGLTLEQAAKEAACSKSYLWELENDKSMPGLDVAARVARAYGLPLGLLGACTLRPNASIKPGREAASHGTNCYAACDEGQQ